MSLTGNKYPNILCIIHMLEDDANKQMLAVWLHHVDKMLVVRVAERPEGFVGYKQKRFFQSSTNPAG
jgi:hypothetical protein